VQMRGSCVVSQGDQQAASRPGDFVLHDTARPYQFSASTSADKALMLEVIDKGCHGAEQIQPRNSCSYAYSAARSSGSVKSQSCI
jgi:AraC-binding-like domain